MVLLDKLYVFGDFCIPGNSDDRRGHKSFYRIMSNWGIVDVLGLMKLVVISVTISYLIDNLILETCFLKGQEIMINLLA